MENANCVNKWMHRIYRRYDIQFNSDMKNIIYLLSVNCHDYTQTMRGRQQLKALGTVGTCV